jgi:adenosyl cobinamide kinase/adenosyl cobinamide phosphate guanylyltransferase
MATNDFKGMRDCWLCDLTERAEEIEYAQRVAEHNIERPEIWAAIEALAARLKHGRMSADEAAKIIHQSP